MFQPGKSVLAQRRYTWGYDLVFHPSLLYDGPEEQQTWELRYGSTVPGYLRLYVRSS